MVKINKKYKIVIPCAGQGQRMGDTNGIPKNLLIVNDRPLLDHIISFWSNLCKEFIFILNPDQGNIEDFLKGLAIKYRIRIQKEVSGAGESILFAEEDIDNEFIVVLGDCLLSGRFKFPGVYSPGIGVWEGADHNSIKSNFGVKIIDGRISVIEEKPKNADGYHCGIGVYFFDKGIFDVIRNTPLTDSGKLEITSVLIQCLKERYFLKPIYFSGYYINVNTPNDLKLANEMFLTTENTEVAEGWFL